MVTPPPQRQVVVPGELIDDKGLKLGEGTYSDGDKVYASRLGVLSEREGYVFVTPLGGRYIPQRDDEVVGQVSDIGPSHWLVDINSPYPAPLHATESPWRVEFGDTARYIDVGDAVLARVLSVDETMRVQLTMRGRGLRKLTGGQVVEVSHSKVPRIIGKGGSMITMIKNHTRCKVFVGQNGRIWIDGETDDIVNAIRAIHMIEERAQAFGLTETVEAFLQDTYGRGG